MATSGVYDGVAYDVIEHKIWGRLDIGTAATLGFEKLTLNCCILESRASLTLETYVWAFSDMRPMMQ